MLLKYFAYPNFISGIKDNPNLKTKILSLPIWKNSDKKFISILKPENTIIIDEEIP